MQETEQILMRVASTNKNPSVANELRSEVSAVALSPLTDPCVPTSAQTLAAVQRYRSGCMAALLELHAVVEEISASVTMSSDIGTTSAPCLPQPSHSNVESGENSVELKNRTAAAVPAAVEMAQLQHNYHLLEIRLSETLAAQAAYMVEVEAQQRQREQDGIVGEYMFTTRLLVEQEAAERRHLTKLCAYVTSTICSHARSSSSMRPQGSTSLLENLASAPVISTANATPAAVVAAAAASCTPLPPQDDEVVARLTAEKEVLLRELSGQSSRTQSLLAAQLRDAQAAHGRALTQLVARHAAEKEVWDTRRSETKREAAELQQRCEQLQRELQHAQEQRRDAQQYASLTQDSLQTQLKDTTRKMWQLQLANDHLDAKVRVLQRELEEVRVSRSPLRGEPMPTSAAATPPPPQNGEAEARHGSARTAATPSPHSIGVPAAARMVRGTGATATTTTSAASLRSIPRLLAPPMCRPVEVDVRHGHPLPPSHDAKNDKTMEQGNCKKYTATQEISEDEVTVNPSVWLAYDERSLLSSATPTKYDRRSHDHYQLSTAAVALDDITVSATSTTSVAYVKGDVRPSSTTTSRRSSALPPFLMSSLPSLKRAASDSTPHRADTAAVEVSYMSEGPTKHISAETRSQSSHVNATAFTSARVITTSAAHSDENKDNNGYSIVSNGSSPSALPPGVSPMRRQLSLDRTPVTVPPQRDSAHSRDASLTTANDASLDAEAEEVKEEPPQQRALERLSHPPRSSSVKMTSEREATSRQSSPSPYLLPFGPSTPASSRIYTNSDLEADDDGSACLPLTAPHGAVVMTPSGPSSSRGSETEEEHEDEAEGEENDSTASLPPSARVRLENVRREILYHMEMLERDVQAVTDRHDAAQRQRRRERNMIRVNATSLHASPTAQKTQAPSREAKDGERDSHESNEEEKNRSTSGVDCALERLHIAQQEDDDQLAQYYAEVNRKREELERCLRVVEERLAPRHRDPTPREEC